MDKTVKNQHYIPQMYLKRFCEFDNQLYAYDKQTGRGFYNSPRAYAHKKYFYDIDPDVLLPMLKKCYPFADSVSIENLSQTQAVENMLGRLEGAAALVLDKIDGDPSVLLDDDVQIKLTCFLYTLSVRTVAQRRKIEYIHRKTADRLKELNISANSKILECYNVNSEEYSKEWQIGRLISPGAVLEFSQMIIENYDWYYGKVNSCLKLIISDNPVLMLAIGFNDFCFPISPDKAIVFRKRGDSVKILSHDKPQNGVVNLSTYSVLVYNIIQHSQSERFLFGDKKTIQLMKAMKKYLES